MPKSILLIWSEMIIRGIGIKLILPLIVKVYYAPNNLIFPAACNFKIWNALNISVGFARVSLPKIGLSAICTATFFRKKLI